MISRAATVMPFKLLDLTRMAKSGVTRRKRSGETGQPCRIPCLTANRGVMPQLNLIQHLLSAFKVPIALLKKCPKP